MEPNDLAQNVNPSFYNFGDLTSCGNKDDLVYSGTFQQDQLKTKLTHSKGDIKINLNTIDESIKEQYERKSTSKKKRTRRTATEIQRHWKCGLCEKSYGTEGALKTHYKLKHDNKRKSFEIRTVYNQSFPKQEPRSSDYSSISVIKEELELAPEMNIKYDNKPMPNNVVLSRDIPKYDAFEESYSPYHDSLVNKDLGIIFDQNRPYQEGDYTSQCLIHQQDFENKNIECASISLLMIGGYVSNRYTNSDMTALFSFLERTLYYEKRESNCMVRMEISFDDILDLHIDPHLNEEVVIVHLLLIRPPRFWNGWIIPSKPILWKPSIDFTEGSASKYRQHSLYFPHYEVWQSLQKLLSQELRLKVLSEKKFLSNISPCFDDDASTHF